MMGRCPVAFGGETRITRESFVRVCKAKRAEVGHVFSPGSGRGLVVEGKRYPQCEDCETGRLVEAWGTCEDCETGLLVEARNPFQPPAGVIFIDALVGATRNIVIATPNVAPTTADGDVRTELHEQGDDDMTEKEETNKWREEWAEVLHRIPDAEIESITIKALRDYWSLPITQKKGSIGTCPNCRRNDMVIRWSGLCSSCDKKSQNLNGYALLDALADTRKRMATRVGLRFKRRVPQQPAAPAIMGNEVAADYRESPIYRLGLHYKEIGEKLMDPATSINDLVAAAWQLGLRIDFNLERRV